MTLKMSDVIAATMGINPNATVHVSIDGGPPIPATGMACTSGDALVCAAMLGSVSARGLYRVTCPEHTEGTLLVISDSPDGAASFLRMRLRDMHQGSPREGPFDGDYHVRRMAPDVGGGIWLSGHDSSDDLEDLLRTEVPDYDKTNPYPLWGVNVMVRLGGP